MNRSARILAAAFCAAFVAPAWAQINVETARANTVELQAQAQREVTNDTLNATLYAEFSDASAAQVADTLNKTLNAALKAAAEVKAVRARSGGNQTNPVYDRANKLTGWRGRAELRLDSKDFQAAAALIGRLQSDMQLSGVSFSVSPELRRQVENELITEAIAAFRVRVDIARKALDARGYKVRKLRLDTAGFAPRPYMAMAESRGISSSAVASPALEGGQSTITVTASGEIAIE